MWNVFLSSTSRDLAPHREAVLRSLRKLDQFHCQAMEDFGARPVPALEYCRSAVQRCDIFVGILANFYGSCPPNSDLSYTEHEYEAALSVGLPVFMFLSPETLPVPEHLAQSSEAKQRQRAFRERVKSARIRGNFTTPGDLAVSVTTALANFALQQTQAGQPSPVAENTRARDRGSLVPKLCDRTQQDEQFHRFLAHHTQGDTTHPLAVFVRGWESERLDSLVTRFCGTTLRKLCERKGGLQQGTLDALPVIEWPVDGPAEIRYRTLVDRVFEAYECEEVPGSDEEAACALLQIAKKRRYPVTAWQFYIPLRRWNATALTCLNRFLEFWDLLGRAPADGGRPVFVLFVQFVYPELRGLRRWLFRPGQVQRQVLSLLNRRQSTGEKVDPCCPSLFLSELTPVHRDDVLGWFRRHRLFDDKMTVWKERGDSIFGKRDTLSMMQVEAALEAIYEEHLQSSHHAYP